MRNFGPERTCGWEFYDVVSSPFDYPGRKGDRAAGIQPPLNAIFKVVVRHDGVEQPIRERIVLPDTRGYTFEELQNIKQQGTHYREGLNEAVLDQAIARFEEKLADRERREPNNNVVVLVAPKAAHG